MKNASKIKIIDLFAGPGGLGEGFSAFTNKDQNPFRIALSIEKDELAHKTLSLRSFVRQFSTPPSEYYAYLAGEISREELLATYPAQAASTEQEAWCCELGKVNHEMVRARISSALDNAENWILIGGPPCQAYSLAGRSRMRGVDPDKFEKDERHFLYQEYLQIIADHQPPVFVMENVKGLVSSTIKGERIFARILEDLKKPSVSAKRKATADESCEYRIYSLVKEPDLAGNYSPEDYVIHSEQYGVPQARHRVILLGIRNDIDVQPRLLQPSCAPHVNDVLKGLPSIRSGLSKEADSYTAWVEALRAALHSEWYDQLSGEMKKNIRNAIKKACSEELSRGANFIRWEAGSKELSKWYNDSKLSGIINHETRAHIVPDLHRYLFAAATVLSKGVSPKLRDFPKQLLPKHKNVGQALKSGLFADRFRVQVGNKYATTITSHISKDGHYYIHPDPSQCRSLTVREAARIQTFPDNYFFEGPRTSQYHQVGNAVPPFLAWQIAGIVHDVLLEHQNRNQKWTSLQPKSAAG